MPLHFVAELQSNLPAILSEFTGLFKQSKVHKKFHRDVLSKGQIPVRKQVQHLSHTTLIPGVNPTSPGGSV